MKTLTTVIAGLGRIGWQFHAPSVAAHPGFHLAAVCDALPERLDEARATYQANGYTDFEEMLAKEQPELVVIATPTHLHVRHAVHAMECGCDVFLDKPIARDLAEADEIIEARRRTGRKLMLYQPQRAEAHIQALRKILQSGVIGEPYMIKMARTAFVFRADWQAFTKYGGGMLNNYGAHMIDAALYLANSKAERIYGQLYNIASAGDADDVVKVLIKTENGIALDLDINMAAALDMPALSVYGRHGAVALLSGTGGGYYHARYFAPGEQARAVASEALAAADRKYITSQPKDWYEKDFPIESDEAINFYDKCYDYFAENGEPFVPLAETREVMRVVEACRREA